jgi:kynurenine formamidase
MHPTHILDVFRSLLFLLHLDGRPRTGNSPSSVYLAGHSCGAHILSFMLAGLSGLHSHLSKHEVSVISTLQTLITGYVFLDGIYDVEDLVVEYPSYAFFVEKAFGDKAAWEAGSIKQLRLDQHQQRLLVAHSRDDDLLTTRQSRNWYELVKSAGAKVEWDENTLKGKHDECLQNEGLGQLLRRFMNR